MAENLRLSVSDFIAICNQTLEYAYPSVEIEGEVASFKVNQGKYVFFDLKDAGGSIGCFMSVWQLRIPIEDGMRVIINGRPKLTPWGKFSITVQMIRPSGEGSIKKSFELLKAKLEGEGLFELERKRPLPQIPTRIGVISSTQAAGYSDFITILDQRWGGVQVDVAHVQVQGDVAADQIIRAIEYFNAQAETPEVLVIIRGGGSADDLAVFNDEKLVRAIAASRVPTLVGVGHEIDTTLADLVADVRAATPSNAAQIVVPDKEAIIEQLHQRVRHSGERIEYVLEGQTRLVRELRDGVALTLDRRLESATSEVAALGRIITSYDPRRVLERGYALLRGETKVGSSIEIETSKHIIQAEVHNVRSKD